MDTCHLPAFPVTPRRSACRVELKDCSIHCGALAIPEEKHPGIRCACQSAQMSGPAVMGLGPRARLAGFEPQPCHFCVSLNPSFLNCKMGTLPLPCYRAAGRLNELQMCGAETAPVPGMYRMLLSVTADYCRHRWCYCVFPTGSALSSGVQRTTPHPLKPYCACDREQPLA